MKSLVLVAFASLAFAQQPAPPAAPTAAPAPSPDLAARLKVIEDRAEIERLLINYGRFLDARKFVDYASLFSKDGEWIGGFGSVKGPKPIQEFMEKNVGMGENRSGTHHVLSNFLIDVTGDTATAWSRWMFMVATGDGKPSPAQSGHYEDKLVREDGKWKFARREAFTDIPKSK